MNPYAKTLAWVVAVEAACFGLLIAIAARYRYDGIGEAILSIPVAAALLAASVTGFVTVIVYLIQIARRKTKLDILGAIFGAAALAVVGFIAHRLWV